MIPDISNLNNPPQIAPFIVFMSYDRDKINPIRVGNAGYLPAWEQDTGKWYRATGPYANSWVEVDSGGSSLSIEGQGSVEVDDDDGVLRVHLVNDEQARAFSQYYGTGEDGALGWYPMPSIGGAVTAGNGISVSEDNVVSTNPAANVEFNTVKAPNGITTTNSNYTNTIISAPSGGGVAFNSGNNLRAIVSFNESPLVMTVALQVSSARLQLTNNDNTVIMGPEVANNAKTASKLILYRYNGVDCTEKITQNSVMVDNYTFNDGTSSTIKIKEIASDSPDSVPKKTTQILGDDNVFLDAFVVAQDGLYLNTEIIPTSDPLIKNKIWRDINNQLYVSSGT